MFTGGKQRLVRAELFKKEFIELSDLTLLVLMALRSWADDDGNVDLALEEFAMKATRWKRTPLDLLYEAVNNLIQEGHIRPYIVEGRYYASIEGWTDDSQPLYSQKPRSARNEVKWRNPTPEEGEPVESIGDASARAVVPRVRRDVPESTDRTGRDRTSGRRVEPSARITDEGLRREGQTPGKRVLRLKKPGEPSKGPEPRSPKRQVPKKLLRPSQRAQMAYTEDTEEDPYDLDAGLRRLRSQLGTRVPAKRTGGTIAHRIGDDWPSFPGEGNRGAVAWLQKHGIRDDELEEAVEYVSKKRRSYFEN